MTEEEIVDYIGGVLLITLSSKNMTFPVTLKGPSQIESNCHW